MRRLPAVLVALALVLTACINQPPASTPPRTDTRRPTATPGPTTPPSAARTSATATTGVAQPRFGSVPEGYQPRFVPTDCPFDPGDEDIRCGELIVPENRKEPTGTQVRLAIAIIASTAQNPEPDPVVYLEGGPGGSALAVPEWWYEDPLRERRDIVLIDQRGTGYSQPSLNCIEMESEEVLTMQDELNAAQACRDRLTSEGVDLTQYNSAATALDLRDLRLALGYEQINLFGVSYGTRAALTMMRDAPEGIRSVILDSAYPPQVDAYNEEASNSAAAILALIAGCAADRACNRAYPDLEDAFLLSVKRMNNRAARVRMTDPETGEEYTERISGDALVDYLAGWLYETDKIPYLPQAIFEVSKARYTTLRALLEETYGEEPIEEETTEEEPIDEEATEELTEEVVIEEEATEVPSDEDELGDISDAEGVFYSVECHEEVPFARMRDARRAMGEHPVVLREGLLSGVEQVFAICTIWGAGRAGEIEDLAVQSDIPTLVLAGEYDPITPPRWGEEAAKHLAQSFFFTFPGMGHAVVGFDPCPTEIAVAFVDAPTTEPDARCIKEMRPTFVTP
jgi:pimeloyl-ACP methyl ester carboxylesterase